MRAQERVRLARFEVTEGTRENRCARTTNASDSCFTGKEEDIDVGLTYFGKRYLSPYLNRWISADPLAVHGLGADPNLYAYVSGMALRAVDPVGLDPDTAPIPVKQAPPGVKPGQRFIPVPAGKGGEVSRSEFQEAAKGRAVFVYEPKSGLDIDTANTLAQLRQAMGGGTGTGGGCTGVECSGFGERKHDTLLDQTMLGAALVLGIEPGKRGVSGGMPGGVGPEENASGKTQAAVAGGYVAMAILLGRIIEAYRAARAVEQGLRALHAPAWTPHGYKHFPSGKLAWKDVVKATLKGPAKYGHGVNVEAIERDVWQTGQSVTSGKTWKVKEFSEEIGASGGKASR